MSESQDAENFIRIVSEKPNLRQKLRQALGIDDDYARRSDLKPILEELVQLRKDMDKRFEAVDKRFEVMDKRFVAMDKRFDDMQKTFGEQLKAIREGFSFLSDRMDKLTTNVRRMGGEDLELLSLSFYRAILDGKLIRSDNLEWRRHFADPESLSGSSDVEIDIFQEDPLTAVEVCSYVPDIDKLNKFIGELRFLKRKFGKTPKTLLITYGFAKGIEDAAIALLKKEGVMLITLGQKE
ncbi:MAG TPA: hypothetical protein VJ044_17880 [Candidatus Hodarchaeales archaeon]|nr:hypothetical protein [Candidatus Hodarchaeales archaeon]